MPLAANTANVHILVDDARRTVVKLWLHQDTAGDEADVLKVNVATLAARTLILATTNVATQQSGFVPGEQVTGGTSGATAFVVFWTPSSLAANGALTVTSNSAAFTNGETITGAVSGHSAVLANPATTVPTYVLDITSIWYSISAGAKVDLVYDDGGTKRPILPLFGNGYYGKNDFGVKVPNNTAVPNGNLYVSTYGVGAKGGYSIIVELKKVKGFAPRPVY